MFRKLKERDSLTMTKTNKIQKEARQGDQYLVRQWASSIILDSSTLTRVEGFKKLARACTKSLGRWNSPAISKVTVINPPSTQSEFLLRRSNLETLTQRNLDTASRRNANYRKIETISNRTKRDHPEEVLLLKALPNVPNSLGGRSKQPPSSRGKLAERNIRHYSSESNIARITSEKPLDYLLLRVVTIKNIPSGVGITSILDKVRGGPLEMTDWTIRDNRLILELYFISPLQAHQFYLYGTRTGMFIVHGARLKVEWCSPKESLHPGLAMSPSISSTIDINCRRCLILSRVVTDRCQSRHYLDPRTHFSHEVNIEDIRRDFLQFGVILDVTPAISRFVSLCIQYTNVRSAVMAKRCCENETTSLNFKYKHWKFTYGKDPTELPCIYP